MLALFGNLNEMPSGILIIEGENGLPVSTCKVMGIHRAHSLPRKLDSVSLHKNNQLVFGARRQQIREWGVIWNRQWKREVSEKLLSPVCPMETESAILGVIRVQPILSSSRCLSCSGIEPRSSSHNFALMEDFSKRIPPGPLALSIFIWLFY